jgi:hypothetical protein
MRALIPNYFAWYLSPSCLSSLILKKTPMMEKHTYTHKKALFDSQGGKSPM